MNALGSKMIVNFDQLFSVEFLWDLEFAAVSAGFTSESYNYFAEIGQLICFMCQNNPLFLKQIIGLT